LSTLAAEETVTFEWNADVILAFINAQIVHYKIAACVCFGLSN